MGILAAEKGIVVVFRYFQVFDVTAEHWAMLKEVCGSAGMQLNVSIPRKCEPRPS
jgi:hypothetical protein